MNQKPLKQAHKMESSKRRRELMIGLTGTREAVVCVEVTHLIEAVGLNKAERLIAALAGMKATVRSPYSSRERVIRCGNCVVSREQVIDAIQEATFKENKSIIDRARG